MAYDLVQCLQEIYDPTEEKFRFASGESFSIYPFDVHVIMGLEDKGTIVRLDENFSAQDITYVYKQDYTEDDFSIYELSRLLWTDDISYNDFIRSSPIMILLGVLSYLH